MHIATNNICLLYTSKVNKQTASIGVALTSCTVPAAGRPTFDINESELEIGVGIHGEPGRRREAMREADEIVGDCVEAILTDFKIRDIHPTNKHEALLLINGFGATPLMELYLIFNTAAKSVSYTHLDVYKRQHVYRAGQNAAFGLLHLESCRRHRL